MIAKIEEKIEYINSWLEKHPGKKGQVCLAFYEKRSKRQGWPLNIGNKDERFYWEQWCLDLTVVEQTVSTQEQTSVSRESAQRTLVLRDTLEEGMTHIIAAVNEKKDHIPPITSTAVLPFPFDISISTEGSIPYGLEVVKRMLMHTSPPSVLS